MAPYRKEVYCEFEFLKKFRNSNGHFSPLDSTDALNVWIGIAKFAQKSHLRLDVDAQKFKKSIKRGDALFSLWKKATEGSCKISFINEHKKEFFEQQIVDSDGLNKVYLLSKNNAICKDFAKKYGVVILTPICWQSNEQAKKVEYLFKDCGSVVEKNREFEWNGILRSEYNLSHCNAAVIIDNYIHKNNKDNLLKIVDCILPESLRNTTFHLTILTEKNEKSEPYEQIYRRLVDNIKKTKPQLHCEVELYVKNGKGEFHDRTILTNNAKIDSGAGFSIRMGKGISENATEIHILHPGIQDCSDTCDISYFNILSEAKKMIQQIEKGCGHGERYPKGETCKNRLINP